MTTVSEEVAFACCASQTFAKQLADGSPYSNFDHLIAAARYIWWQGVGIPDWLAAFAAHPKIGDRKGVDDKPAAFRAFSQEEQSAAAQSATAETTQELASWNERYFNKFGFIFIICAKGRSSADILASLKRRYESSPFEELMNAAREQMRITELRLADAVMGPRMQRRADQVLQHLVPTPHGSSNAALRSPITTHVLDTALGVPAQGLPLALLKLDEDSGCWERVADGLTNIDGRVVNLLPPSNELAAGRYRMYFDTATYFALCQKKHPGFYSDKPFYPEVTINFQISLDKVTEHYHIPLLLSPYGYSTYRGS